VSDESFNPVIAGRSSNQKARQLPYPKKKERDGTTKKDHQRSFSLCMLRSPREHRERKRQSERARRPEESDGTDGNHLCVMKENKGARSEKVLEEGAAEEFFFSPRACTTLSREEQHGRVQRVACMAAGVPSITQ
jgi:hypothetical protein